MPTAPRWLAQIHGSRVVTAEEIEPDETRADAATTGATATVCAVLTADCPPVLLCDRDGSRVGAAHAGWRGWSPARLERTVEARME
ncbi:MAG: laccase domain-containing protein [Arhodomonas sp.]|nr:laccase domain-containing protein [Arhodomonas sp.]